MGGEKKEASLNKATRRSLGEMLIEEKLVRQMGKVAATLQGLPDDKNAKQKEHYVRVY
jgi:hypothetical protein